MVYYNRVILSGTGYSNEKWATGFAAVQDPENGGDPVVGEDALTGWAESIRTQFSMLNVGSNWLRLALSTAGYLTKVRVEARENDTLIAAGESIGAAVAGGGTPVQPAQVSAVIGLRSDLAGRSRRGRMYWPAWGMPINTTTGHIGDDRHEDLAQDFASFLEGVVTSAPGTYEPVPVIYSRTLGAVTQVTRVQVGDVFDTQRRRRDKLVEDYFTVDL